MSAFSGIRNCLDNNQADILCKATVLENFNYCPVIWMFSFKATNREINRTYKQALWVLHKDNLSFDKCLMKYSVDNLVSRDSWYLILCKQLIN